MYLFTGGTGSGKTTLLNLLLRRENYDSGIIEYEGKELQEYSKKQINADIMFLDKNLMKWIRRKKMSVLTFTIVSQKQLTKAKNLEVDGIIIEDHNLNCN